MNTLINSNEPLNLMYTESINNYKLKEVQYSLVNNPSLKKFTFL